MTQVRRLRAPPPPPRAPRRVLCVLLSECGSMVLADPALRCLTEDAGAEVYFLTFAHNRPALGITDTVTADRIFCLRTDSLLTLLADVLRWRCWLRARAIDSIVDFELFACLSAVLCAASGVRRRVGFHAAAGGVGRYRGDLYTHRVAYDPARHIAHNYLALADALAGRQPVRGAGLPQLARRCLRDAETEAVQALLSTVVAGYAGGPLLLVNPNASEFLPQRRWPVPHFLSLISLLLERHADLTVLLVGGASDVATTAAIAAAIADPRCADSAGRLALPELPALFAAATVMVSNDSGPAHFAAVSDLPVVVLFGPETPALYRPLGRATVLSASLACSPCVNVGNQRQTGCQDNICMSRIAVETVLQAVETILADSAAPGARHWRAA